MFYNGVRASSPCCTVPPRSTVIEAEVQNGPSVEFCVSGRQQADDNMQNVGLVGLPVNSRNSKTVLGAIYGDETVGGASLRQSHVNNNCDLTESAQPLKVARLDYVDKYAIV